MIKLHSKAPPQKLPATEAPVKADEASRIATKADLSHLTREEKLELIDALEARNQKQKHNRDAFRPNSLQLEVRRSLKRIRFVASANGVGKTTLGVQEAWDTSQGTHPYRPALPVPNRGVVILDSPDKVDRWLEELNKWFDTRDWVLKKNGKPYVTEINLPNGSELVFMFHLQEPMAFESFEGDYAIFDEPPPRHVYVGIQRSLRRVNGAWTLIVGTPLTQPWLKEKIWDAWANGERDDVECFKAGIYVNEANLGQDYIANFSKDLTPAEAKVRLEGDFAHLEGLALADLFRRSIHIVEPFPWVRHWPTVLAVDPHPAKPHHAVLLGIDKWDRMFVLKEIKSKSAPAEFALELKEFIAGFDVHDQICDSLGATPRTGGWDNYSFIDVVNMKGGLRLRSTTFKEKSEDAWVQNFRDLLTLRKNNLGEMAPGIYFFSHCTGTTNDCESVMWRRNRLSEEVKGHLDTTNRDFLSCLKYALASPPCYNRIAAIYKRPPATSYGMRKR